MRLDDADRELLEQVASQQAEMLAVFERFRPLLERYERASQANGFRQLRKVAKGEMNGR